MIRLEYWLFQLIKVFSTPSCYTSTKSLNCGDCQMVIKYILTSLLKLSFSTHQQITPLLVSTIVHDNIDAAVSHHFPISTTPTLSAGLSSPQHKSPSQPYNHQSSDLPSWLFSQLMSHCSSCSAPESVAVSKRDYNTKTCSLMQFSNSC